MDIKVAKITRANHGTLGLIDDDGDLIGTLTFWPAPPHMMHRTADAVTWVHDALAWRASIEDVKDVGAKISAAFEQRASRQPHNPETDPYGIIAADNLQAAARMAAAADSEPDELERLRAAQLGYPDFAPLGTPQLIAVVAILVATFAFIYWVVMAAGVLDAPAAAVISTSEYTFTILPQSGVPASSTVYASLAHP
jgi:hypothetical protein